MAINRSDTPLAVTPDPPKDGGIKKTQSTNPETGVTTYKQSWGNSYGRKSSAAPTKAAPAKAAPVKREPVKAASSVSAAPAKTSGSTAGSREFSTFPSPKAAGAVTQKITAPTIDNSKKFVPSTTKEKRIEKQVSTYNKEKKEGESFDTYRARRTSETQAAIKKGPEKKEKWAGVGGRDASKNKSGACTTC